MWQNSKSSQAQTQRTGIKVAGVRIVNYRYRHLQSATMAGAAEHGKYDWIVKFNDGVGDEQVAEFCGDECLAMGHPGHGGVPLATVRATEGMLEKLLERFPNVAEFIEPDSPIDVDDVASEGSQGLWGHNTINLAQAQFTGKGVHIYVMDTGIRVSHRDFGGRAIPTLDTTSGGTKECARGDISCASDDRGHGTHVAGTAGGATYGVAKEAELHTMKVCCAAGTSILAGMDWVAQFALKPAVMTMSLGADTTPESSRVAVDAVVKAGVTVIVSAGNQGTESCLKSYTFIASAIGVGASTSTNKRASFRTWASNWGTCNAIYAPGEMIVSADYRSDYRSLTKNGTSMAAPMVAGAAALLLEEDPALTPVGVRSTLRARATKNALTMLKTGDPNFLLNVGSQCPGWCSAPCCTSCKVPCSNIGCNFC